MQELDELAERFWAWRASQQPRTRDDIPRLDRPAGSLPEVDPALAGRRRAELAAFQAELARIHPDQVPDRIDQRLLRAVPATLSHAPDALARPAKEFAELAVAELDGIDQPIAACARALARIEPAAAAELSSAAAEAGAALREFGGWLTTQLPALAPARPIGRPQYEWFLREVACVPLTVDEIATIGHHEYERAVWLELLHATRSRDLPAPALPADAGQQVRTHARDEEAVRRF